MHCLAFILIYFIVGYYVGKGMYRAGFAGSEDTVRLFGGIMWPMTIWLLILESAGIENIKD